MLVEIGDCPVIVAVLLQGTKFIAGARHNPDAGDPAGSGRVPTIRPQRVTSREGKEKCGRGLLKDLAGGDIGAGAGVVKLNNAALGRDPGGYRPQSEPGDRTSRTESRGWRNHGCLVPPSRNWRW